MVCLTPPHLATSSRPSYGEAYAKILAAHRHSPLTSASSVIILVAPDVDALCAARMLATLFRQDDVMHRIVPVSGIAELERIRDELVTYPELRTLILLNMGSILDLPSSEWFGDFGSQLTVHVVDSARPQNLSSLFGAGVGGDRIVVWDDGGAEDLEEERKSWEALAYKPEADSDDDEDSEADEEVDAAYDDADDVDGDDEQYDGESPSGKRRSSGEGSRSAGKRRKISEDRPARMSRDERDSHAARLERYYMTGTSYGQSAAGTIYVLATVLERVDNDLLWLAILGLTHQYIASRISRTTYDKYHSIYYDEVFRLNPPLVPKNGDGLSLHPDDQSVRVTEDLRFMLYRHWTLYDAMYHSSYVASKLGIWRERGRKRLTGLLAKMGFSIPQTQQPYSHMDLDLKRQLRSKLDAIAPEYGLLELAYPSFMRCFGYHSQPLSAADTVEAVSALLDVAGGVRMEVEIEGARNGGEWFGGGKLWESKKEDEQENVPPGGNVAKVTGTTKPRGDIRPGEQDNDGEDETTELQWWVRNFWTAYDVLDDINSLHSALSLAMSLHRAIIRQGSSIIDKQDIRTMRSHRVVVLSQGPDLDLFSHPGVLSRLALWLVDALRDRVSGVSLPKPGLSADGGRRGKGKKSLPFVLACLNEKMGTYIVVGVMAALDFGDVRKNEFGLAFLDAKERCNARTRHGSFDTSVIEINQADLKMFLETLCDAADGY